MNDDDMIQAGSLWMNRDTMKTFCVVEAVYDPAASSYVTFTRTDIENAGRWTLGMDQFRKRFERIVEPPYEVRSSTIHERGAFATRRIVAEERIVEYAGELIDADEAEERTPYLGAHTVLMDLDDDVTIDANVNGNSAKYINHSCDPNCYVQVETKIADARRALVEMRAFIYALRDIEVGEELTFDYALQVDDPADEDTRLLFACYCGSENCRHTMIELPDESPAET